MNELETGDIDLGISAGIGEAIGRTILENERVSTLIAVSKIAVYATIIANIGLVIYLIIGVGRGKR